MVDLIRVSNDTWHLRVNKNGNIVFLGENAKKIKKAYITFLPSELIVKTVEISAKVKENLVESVIKAKLSKEIKDDFVFVYYLESKKDEINVYKAEVLLKKEILFAVNKIKTKNIELITTDYHSLFTISKRYFKDHFISVYITSEHIIYAGGKERLEFFRSVPTPSTPQEIAEDINRTVIYFKQHTKNLLLNTLLSGDTELINKICTQIKAEVSQPLSFIKNINNEKFNKYFLIFGALFAKENFLPDEIKNYKNFKKAFLLVASFLLATTGYLGYQTFKKKTALTQNENILSKKQREFVKLKNTTQLLDEKTLNYYLTYAKTQKEAQKSNFISQLNKTKPLFKYFLPYSVSVDKNIRVSFEKTFSSFKEMITQKEEIESLLKRLKLKYYLQPNYETKRLELTVVLKRPK